MVQKLERFHYQIPTNIHFGNNVIDEMTNVIEGITKDLLFLSMKDLPVAQIVANFLKKEGFILTEFYDIEPNPSSTTVDAIAKIGIQNNCKVIVAVGGGSVIDAAKAASIVMTHEGNIWEYTVDMGEKRRLVTHPTIPIMAVPTTAGTGAEVTQNSIITNPLTKQKAPIRSSFICPAHAFIDPTLMVTMPRHITLATGFDAFTHAFEKYFGPQSFPYIDIIAFDAMETVVKNLENAVKKPNDLETRGNMAWASTQAALCVLAESFESGLHVFSLPITGLFGVSHGEALALCMKFTLEELVELRPERVANLSKIFLSNDDFLKMDQSTKCKKCIDLIMDWLERLDLNKKLRDYGIESESLEKIAKNTNLQRLKAAWQKDITEQDVINMLRKNL